MSKIDKSLNSSLQEPVLLNNSTSAATNTDFRLLAADSEGGSEYATPVVKDNRTKAIICMNLFAIGAMGNSIVFKLAQSAGAQVIDYQVFRNLSILFFSSLELSCLRRSPFSEFPSEQKYTLLWRCLTGQTAFFLFNCSLGLIPLTFLMIIFQTGSFWTSLLAYCAFKEPLLPLELISMAVCFEGMVTITLSGAKNASAELSPDETDSAGATYTKTQLTLGYSLIFITSWIYASNCVLNRALKGVHHAVVMFWHGICGITFAAIGLTINAWLIQPAGTPFSLFNYDANVYLLMLGATLFDSLGVNAVTIAFQSDSSGFVALIGYVNILYAFIADLLIFKESFEWLEFGAACVILIATVGTSVYKIKESHQAKLRRADSFTSAEDVNRSMVKLD